MNILVEALHLKKGEILSFPEPKDLSPNDLTTKTVYKAVFQNEDPIPGIESDFVSENEEGLQKTLITSPTDIEVHFK